MKNESGTKEDISMLDALQRLWHHRAKRKPIVFAKVWSRMDNDWQYLVKDGEYTPQFVYGERQVVSAIMEISGMSLCGNTVRYRIDQK